jgi:hypothetical protein
MSYIGIIAAIQEHTYDKFCENVSGHVYIYLNPLGHTLKSFASIEYEFRMRSKREKLQKWFREVSKWFHYITDGSSV